MTAIPRPRRGRRRPSPENGTATVLVLALAAVVLAVAAALGLGGAAQLAGSRARTAADLAAPAAADALARGDDPCSGAERVAARNGAALVRCDPDPEGVRVVVEVAVAVLGLSARASARAEPGPLAASPPSIGRPSDVQARMARGPPG